LIEGEEGGKVEQGPTRTEPSKAVINVKVIPNSTRSMLAGVERDVYRIKLTSPPVEGRANEELKRLLAKKLGIAKSLVRIVSGEQSRTKRVEIQGLTLQRVQELLHPSSPSSNTLSIS
jgi:uncharacterized protein